jgi:hypothetical protein
MDSPSWSIDEWCNKQIPSNWDSLQQTSSIEFLQRLNLSSVHPFCNPLTAPNPYEIPGVPGQGPLQNFDHLETWWDVLITIIATGAPSLAAMAELWLRLFSSVLAPLGTLYLLYLEFCDNGAIYSSRSAKKSEFILPFVCWITTTASVVILTDTMYILEYGPTYGGTLLGLSFLLSWSICARNELHKTRWGLMAILLLATILLYDKQTGQIAFGDPNDAVAFEEGLYYDGAFFALVLYDVSSY